jgi:phosphatidylserine decarboxylase
MELFFSSQLALKASRLMGLLADVRLPTRVLRPVIRAYSLLVGVSEDDAVVPPGGFVSFGEFFTRSLKTDLRPVCDQAGCLVNPCDGVLLEWGSVDHAGSTGFFIKGERYDLDGLLGKPGGGDVFTGGGYAVFYLHPRDCHRVVVPVDGRLELVRAIPGSRFPVAGWFDGQAPGIYGRNERMVFIFNVADRGYLAIVMVAAFGVGNIDSRYSPNYSFKSPVVRERFFDIPAPMARGEDLAAFRLGSTVVMAWSPDLVQLDTDLINGPVRMSRRLGKLIEVSDE